MAGVSAVFGQFERKRIAERVRAALKARKTRASTTAARPRWLDGRGRNGKATDRPVTRAPVHDPDRAPVIRHLFKLAAHGLPDSVIARHLNAEGYRTRSGRPWDRRAVQNHVTNAWHAGRVAPWRRAQRRSRRAIVSP